MNARPDDVAPGSDNAHDGATPYPVLDIFVGDELLGWGFVLDFEHGKTFTTFTLLNGDDVDEIKVRSDTTLWVTRRAT